MARQLKFEFELGGNSVVLDFGMYCWELFCEKMNIGPDELLAAFQGGTTFKSMRMLAYCGLSANDFLLDVPETYTEVEVAKMLNDSPEVMNDIFNKAMECFYGIKEEKPKSGQKKSPSRSKKSKK